MSWRRGPGCDALAADAASAGWRPVWQVLVSLAPYRWRLLATILLGLAGQLAALAAAGLSAWLVGRVVTGTRPRDLVWPATLMLILAAAQGTLAWVQTFVAHDYAFKMITVLRQRMFQGLDALSPGYLLRNHTGDLAARLIGDLERLEWLYAHILPGAVPALGVPLAAGAMLTALAPGLGLTVTGLTVLLATIPAWLAGRAHRQGIAVRGELGTLHADLVEGVQGLRDLVMLSYGPRYLARLGRRMAGLRSAHLAYGRRTGAEQAAADLIVAATTGITLWATITMISDGSLAPQYFAVIVLLVSAMLGPVALLVGALGALGEVRGAAARVAAVAAASPTVTERSDPVELPPGPVRVAFHDVRFRYRPDLPPVLSGINFTVAPGETVALVGESGVGKTTCAHLLSRFWDVETGSITLNGVDSRDLRLRELRAAIASVPQDTYLFAMSVADNLRLGRPEATDEQVRQAATRANAAGFIEALPDGYHTVLAERGQSLSAGQRQRLAIARAFLQDAPVLVLDEATSNIDQDSEAQVAEALSQLRQGRATLLIAHRESTIALADRVVVLTDTGMVNPGGDPGKTSTTRRPGDD